MSPRAALWEVRIGCGEDPDPYVGADWDRRYEASWEAGRVCGQRAAML